MIRKDEIFPSSFPRLVVELGMGDGRLLETLAKNDHDSLYIGIELDNDQCRLAQSRISLSNVAIINRSFKDVVPRFLDESIDEFLSVLPDPAFIDIEKEHHWKPFYKEIYIKLKKGGRLRLITELTNELWHPVSDKEYSKWSDRLKFTFESLGFVLSAHKEGAPGQYFSSCLEQFRGDPKRIRMITLDLLKH
ncbi:MAG: methyltransferase domain-containing protein [Thermoproteota archaeon]|nr:methyltransferase domain-containing protein [Thermoproteota archaeon]